MVAPARHEIELDDDTEALDADDLRLPGAPALPDRLTVPAGSEAERLDKALARLLPEVSRSRIKQWIEGGAVRLNDRIPGARTLVLAGDTIDLAPPPSPEATAFRAEPVTLDIVYADAAILVIDKPPGLVVHPAAGNWSGTLLNGLLAYDARLAGLPRAGIVHRLDAGTSGLMVVGRTAAAQLDLVRQLQARSVTREYWAIVYGAARAHGTVEGGIARDPRQPLRFKVSAAAHAKPARTHYRRIETTQAAGRTLSWLACRLDTGRTHQIRVHLESIGLPLIGDPTYRRGRPAAAGVPEMAWTGFPRQALHACRLAIVHPDTSEPMQWFREPPPDMQDLMATLGFHLRGRAKANK
jgi:23S rRNA pseudouridine1911/1915/1917 synthase